MSGSPAVLPEDRDLSARFDAALAKDEPAAIAHASEARAALIARGLSPLDDVGWPLRPLFLSRARLEQASAAMWSAMHALRDHLLALWRDDRAAFRRAVPLADELTEVLNLEAALSHPDFGLVMRPDGFLFEDGFTMTEPNMGNGYLVSCAYPELVYDALQSAPAMSGLGGDYVRPLEEIERFILERVKPGELVAMLLHHEEHGIILSWPERVMDLIEFSRARLIERGVRAVLVHEDDLVVTGGQAQLRDGQRVSLVVQVPIGTHFMYRPELLAGPLAHWTKASAGDAPFLQPLAHLILDKGTMPALSALDALPVVTSEGFTVELAESFYPTEEHAAALRANKADFVLKRSFEGKDTFVGVSTAGRPWNRVLRAALDSKDYVAQRYVPMPTAIMPMVIDGRVERVKVRVELSILVVEGRYAGAFARYAPDAEGLVLSPPPEDMGFTVVMTC